jgi:hypothetical protein
VTKVALQASLLVINLSELAHVVVAHRLVLLPVFLCVAEGWLRGVKQDVRTHFDTLQTARTVRL